MNPTRATLASRVRARRKALGLSQEQLASAAGCHSSTVQHIESGATRPRSDILQAIARELGVSVDDLLTTKEIST